MKRAKRSLCAVLLTAVAGTSVAAHHSYAAYDRDRIIDVEGVVGSFEWISPHSFLRVKADDGRLYIGEWRAAAAMQRIGVEKDTIRAGDRVVMSGNPKRDIEVSGIVNITSVRRLSDGLKWPAQEPERRTENEAQQVAQLE
jgi:hypothetical protein